MSLLVSLIGEQPLPNLLPIRVLKPDQNLLVYTDKTEPVARRLRTIISGAPDLSADLKVPPFDIGRILSALRNRLHGDTPEVVYNLTGGTKLMTLAAFALARETDRPFLYLDSQRSLLKSYRFEEGAPVSDGARELPALISVDDFLRAQLPGYSLEGFHCDAGGNLSDGGRFEQAVFHALQSRLDEVLAGVRPEGVAHQIEIDLVFRCGNAAGIAEVKLGGKEGGKRGLDQLKMAGEPTYLGTFTRQFLITAAARLSNEIRILAHERGVHILQVPGYRDGQPLSRTEAERLAGEIRRILVPQSIKP